MGMDGIEKVDLLWLLGCDRSIDDVEEWLVMKNKMGVVVSCCCPSWPPWPLIRRRSRML